MNVFAQKNYFFDYSSTYEYKVHETDSSNTKITILANSLTEDYLLKIIEEKGVLNYCYLIDFSENKKARIHNFNLELNLNNQLSIDTFNPLEIKNCDDYTNKYTIDYIEVKGVKAIRIRRYKNKKKKKIINESIFFTKPSSNIKNQQFSFPPLIFPLRCEKFKLQTNEVITEVNFIEENKNIYFYKLLEIKFIDFKLEM